MSGTITQSQTFTITNARYLASKVKTDLTRMRNFYGSPSEASIEKFELELAALLAAGYLSKVTYGFRRNGAFVAPSIEYTAEQLAAGWANDRPGGIMIGANIVGATFYSFLEYNSKWFNLAQSDRMAFEDTLPVQRPTADTPGVSGYYESDRSYASGGTALSRKSLMAWS